MSTKKWIVDFNLVELKGGKNWQSIEVEAANPGNAVNRAWAEIRERNGVKGKRITEGTAKFRLEKDSGE